MHKSVIILKQTHLQLLVSFDQCMSAEFHLQICIW